jgi:hypothetical protein
MVQVLSKEKIRLLAGQNGWSLARAEGYIDGETYRRRGTRPSRYVEIGIDEYSLGFRAGYYERENIKGRPSVAAASTSGKPIASSSLEEPKG